MMLKKTQNMPQPRVRSELERRYVGPRSVTDLAVEVALVIEVRAAALLPCTHPLVSRNLAFARPSALTNSTGRVLHGVQEGAVIALPGLALRFFRNQLINQSMRLI